MSIVRWQPRSLARTDSAHGLDNFSNEMERLFDWAFGENTGWSRPMFPALDVIEEENRYVVCADLPGLTREDVEITYQDGTLTLRGEKKARRPERKDGENTRVYNSERFHGKFGRNLHLPEKVDVERIEATFKDGVLELVLPFTPEAQPRRIPIRNS